MSQLIQISPDGKTRIMKTGIGLTVDVLCEGDGRWVTMATEIEGQDVSVWYTRYAGEVARLIEEDFSPIEFETVGIYALNNEHQVKLFRVTGLPSPSSADIIEAMRLKGISPSQTGVEGCPGQWFISSVKVVCFDEIYNYGLVEVHAMLDV